jgi:hypothetical protein
MDVSGREKVHKIFSLKDLLAFVELSGTPQASNLERVKGIEPSSLGWEPRALPLSYTRRRRGSLFYEGRRRGRKWTGEL